MHDIPIVMLHSVNPDRAGSPMGKLSVSPEGLEAYLKVFQKQHYHMISIAELLAGKYDADGNFAVLTFDDGFKDNLTVARRILEKYNAHATIFVNPDFSSEESDLSSDWGFMTWDEVKEAEQSGVFDIQAHTMTHEFIFVSDRIVDYYTPGKFDRYYWLAWMLFPESPRRWNSGAYAYRDRIPTGYPIFEYGRRISQRRFVPDQAFIDYLLNAYANGDQQPDGSGYDGPSGVLEEEKDYRDRVIWEIAACKEILERQLDKTISALCFPGSGYTDYALQQAEECGYKCYMIGSKQRKGNNFEHLEAIRQNRFDGLNRMSFPRRYPTCLPKFFAEEWMARIGLGTFQRKPGYLLLQKAMSKMRRV